VLGDLLAYLADTSEQYDAICLDIDNGPDWTVTDSNAGLYTDEGTELLVSRLTPDGVLTVWSAARSAAYERVLARHFGHVGVVEIPVPRGEPDVVFAATEPVKQTRGRDSDSS
jgi:spermidine synthase